MKGGSGSAFPKAGSPNIGNRERGRTADGSSGPYQALFDLTEHEPGRGHANQNVAASETRLLSAKQLPQDALHPVAIDRARKDALGNDQPESGNAERIGSEQHAESGTPERPSAGEKRGDVGRSEALPSTVTPADAQTLNRARPLARRARMTARPPRVRMRTRNP